MLLTRLPLMYSYKYVYSSLDLHALGAPLAFILSHDQTLRFLTVLANFRVLTLDSSRSCSASYHYSTVKVLPMTRISFCEMRTPMRALHRHCNLMPFLAPVLPAIVFLCTLNIAYSVFLSSMPCQALQVFRVGFYARPPPRSSCFFVPFFCAQFPILPPTTFLSR